MRKGEVFHFPISNIYYIHFQSSSPSLFLIVLTHLLSIIFKFSG